MLIYEGNLHKKIGHKCKSFQKLLKGFVIFHFLLSFSTFWLPYQFSEVHTYFLNCKQFRYLWMLSSLFTESFCDKAVFNSASFKINDYYIQLSRYNFILYFSKDNILYDNFQFLTVVMFRNVTLKCLTEISGVTVTHYDDKFVGKLWSSYASSSQYIIGFVCLRVISCQKIF